MKKNKGFTLIELLVVIAIIGLLSSIVLVSLAEARQKAINNSVIQSMYQLRNALELYAADHNGLYPGEANGFSSVSATRKNNASIVYFPATGLDLVSELSPYIDGDSILSSPIVDQQYVYYENQPYVACNSTVLGSDKYIILVDSPDNVFESNLPNLFANFVGWIYSYYCISAPE